MIGSMICHGCSVNFQWFFNVLFVCTTLFSYDTYIEVAFTHTTISSYHHHHHHHRIEIHEVWNNIQRGPGSAKERHALRNACVPKDAGYGHVCTIDPNGLLTKRIRDVFEVKQKKVQMKGLTESEALWSCFHGNEDAMQKAIAKGDLREMNGMYYWHRDIHEHIT